MSKISGALPVESGNETTSPQLARTLGDEWTKGRSMDFRVRERDWPPSAVSFPDSYSLRPIFLESESRFRNSESRFRNSEIIFFNSFPIVFTTNLALWSKGIFLRSFSSIEKFFSVNSFSLIFSLICEM